MEHSNLRKKHNYKFTISTLTLSCLMAFNAQAAVDCSPLEAWDAGKVYNGGEEVKQGTNAYKAKYWTQNNDPATAGEWGAWQDLGVCSGEVPNEAPTVDLTSPSATEQLTTGDLVTLTASAADSDGNIVRVDFSVDGVVISSVTASPYSTTWTALEGNHTISAQSYDDKGAQSTVSSVAINVTNTPTDNIAPTATLSLSATNVELGSVVTLTADAVDSDGTIDKVDFYIDNTLVGTAATAPYTLQYTTTAVGSLSVYAKATDNLGATANSASTNLTVTSSLPVADNCRPDGLYQTEGVTVPYCTIYDKEGREKMGADHPRRVIGYFTS